jgi:hypothetical protein
MAIIRKSTSELSIKPKMSPQLKAALSLIGVLMFAASLYLSYHFGVQAGHTQVEKDRATIGRLNATIGNLRADLEKASEDLIIAQRHQQIQEEAYEQINAAYASSEKKNRYLGSRLDFYRSIISPEDGSAGPAIQALEAEVTDTGLDFDVTLVQAINHKQQIQGSLEVSLTDGEKAVAIWPKGSPRSVNYQYFEQVSGSFEVAEVSDNARISVKLVLQSGEQLTREYLLSTVLKTG